MHTNTTRCTEPDCEAGADYTTPYGFRCGPHAMERLARDIARGDTGWMPLRFHRQERRARVRLPAGA